VNPTPTLPGATATPTASGFTVTITIGGGDGTGVVTANPPGPNYPPGTVVTLTAVADAGSCFGGWTASCESFGHKAICTVTISASTKVGAEFDKVCSTPTPAPTPTTVTYCHSIVAYGPGAGAGTCPSGATQFCDTVPIVGTGSAQAQAACNSCFGGACTASGLAFLFTNGTQAGVFAYGPYVCGPLQLLGQGQIGDISCNFAGRWAP
jgi:hypothetical protein